MDKVTVVLTQSQLRDAAMREQGICPVRLALKPGIRVEKSKRHAERTGREKHKKRLGLE